MGEVVYHQLTIHEASRMLAAGEVTSVGLTEAVLERISAVEGEVKAYLALRPERALKQARAADAVRAAHGARAAHASWVRGETRPLLGVPVAVKDVLCTSAMPTTAGSRILEGFVPPYDATVVERLEKAGAVITGKTNTDEFAMGSSTENSAYHTTCNPWDLTRVPGGSSGGSAAAVAAGECVAALGSDTGGSVRQPASLCGVVGLKPTYGRVSRYGLIAFASSLDQVGVLTRDVTDAAIMLGAIAGHDPRDGTSMDLPVPDYTEALTGEIAGVRVGVPDEYFIEGLQPEVEEAVLSAVDELASLGADVHPVRLPHAEYALSVYYLIAPAEASANLARYDGVRYGVRAESETLEEMYKRTRGEGFGPEVKRRIMLGTYALSAGYYDAYYLKAQQVRTLIRDDFEAAFEKVDVIIGPTTPSTAFRIGEKVEDPLQMYLSDVFTLSMNLAGICGLSLPCGFDDQGLPIGMQLTGPAFGEGKVLRVAHAYEQATGWHERRAELNG